MAKVYDALKRVEEERRQFTLAPAARGIHTQGLSEAERSRARSWWPARWSRRTGKGEARPAADDGGFERVQSALTRLDSLERRTSEQIPAVEKHLREVRESIPAIEEHLQQAMETRLRSIEEEHRLGLAALANELDRRMTRINTRLAILLAVVSVGLFLLLLRL